LQAAQHVPQGERPSQNGRKRVEEDPDLALRSEIREAGRAAGVGEAGGAGGEIKQDCKKENLHVIARLSIASTPASHKTVSIALTDREPQVTGSRRMGEKNGTPLSRRAFSLG
jgi:hypothetical protein